MIDGAGRFPSVLVLDRSHRGIEHLDYRPISGERRGILPRKAGPSGRCSSFPILFNNGAGFIVRT